MFRRIKHLISSTSNAFNLATYYESSYILNNRAERIMYFWAPICSILIVWWLFYPGTIRKVPIGVLDYSQSYYSREFVRLTNASPNVEVVTSFLDPIEAQKALNDAKVFALIIIPYEFSPNIKSGKQNTVVLRVNAQYGTHSEIIKSGITDVAMAFSTGIKFAIIEKTGVGEKYSKELALPLIPSVKMDANLELNYQKFLATSIPTFVVAILAAMSGAYCYGRNLRDKDLDKWYYLCCEKMTLVHFFFALNGKIFPALVLYSLWGIFDTFLGNTINFASMSNLITICMFKINIVFLCVNLGVVLTIMFRSLRLGLSSSAFITSPAFSFSGAAYPLVAMPPSAQFVAKCLPMAYYVKLHVGQLILHDSPIYAMNIMFWFGIIGIILNAMAVILGYLLLRTPKYWGAR